MNARLASLRVMAGVASFLAGACMLPTEVNAKLPKLNCGIVAAGMSLPCKKWTYDFDSNNPSKYTALFPNNCDNTYGTLTCYWTSPGSACKAFIQDENKIHPNSPWTYVKATKSAGDPEIYRCSYKLPGSNQEYDDHLVRIELAHFFPYQQHCDIQVNGPYRNCSDTFTYCNKTYSEGRRGFEFTTTQKNRIKQTNRNKNGGMLKSDLAGFRYPKPPNEACIEPDPADPNFCIEPDLLTEAAYTPNSVELHHVIPKKDRQGCNCGKNSMSNAVLISRQLNRNFLNYQRPQAEITAVNAAGTTPYTCAP